MSLAGFKKQLNKANQYMSEKIGGAEATKLDEDFVEMERKTDITNELVEELQTKTKTYLQPNPASRAKMSASNTMAKIQGQAKQVSYPQPEGQLGETMVRFGQQLGMNSNFGTALLEVGEAYKQLADIKYALEDNVKQNFLEPLQLLQSKDLKEVMHHRKKLHGRRLDYDCKRRKKAKGSNVPEEEMRMAEDKFEESWNLAEAAMVNLLENDVEQISQLHALVQAQQEYFRQSADVLEEVLEKLEVEKQDAASRPKREASIHRLPRNGSDSMGSDAWDSSGADAASNAKNRDSDSFAQDPWGNNSSAAPPSYSKSTEKKPAARGPCCEALYDFEPENEGELGFQEGDVLQLIAKIDENWYEGSIRGNTGFFPVNYVKVLVDL
ncbi:PREDICTED: endophilin-A3-like isoform X2 [Priapulus caudatus]|uniref:Endophilin-A3-like isoform X2 n=1 Tax=Priapulus caudatus TaxID=37621 RepID=A0ABM1EH61_PRICU|nr:PREDICTED: endophilin-A3-like isoform X2 [Priapulus caudatus]